MANTSHLSSIPHPSLPITTIIYGTGERGFSDGPAHLATFHKPYAVCLNKEGCIFVTDRDNNAIRKIDKNMHVTTYAGSGEEGCKDSTNRHQAQFQNPYAIVIDDNDVLYVGDESSIRRITVDEGVKTVGGCKVRGFADGTASKSKFNYVTGLAIDKQGNLIAVDYQNHRIRKIFKDGTIKTIGGKNGCEGYMDGDASVSMFKHPWGVVIDEEENIIISDCFNHKIRKIDKNEHISLITGTDKGFHDGDELNAKFNYPCQLAYNKITGDLLVVEEGNNRIRKIDSCSYTTTLKVDEVAGIKLNLPNGIAIRNNGNIIVADTYNHRIIEFIDRHHYSDWPHSHNLLSSTVQKRISETLLVTKTKLPRELLILLIKKLILLELSFCPLDSPSNENKTNDHPEKQL